MVDVGTLRFIFEGDRSGIEKDLELIRRDGLNAAQQVTDALGQIGVNFNTKDSSASIDDLVGRLLETKGALEADPNIALQYSKEAAILQEQVRFKQELSRIQTLDPDTAATAEALARELNSLNLKRIESDFEDLNTAASGALSEIFQGVEQIAISIAGGAEEPAKILEGIQKGLDQIVAGIGKGLDEALEALGKGLDQVFLGIFQGIGQSIFDSLAEALSGIPEFLASQFQQSVQAGAQVEQLRVALEVMTGSAEQGQETLEQLIQFAATTPFELPQVQAAGQSLLAFGFSTNELTTQLRRVGDVAAGVGTPIGELAEIYGKARVQGRLFAEDINQLTGRGVPIIQELASQFGVTESEVRGLVESGQVGFAQLEEAFTSLTSEGGKFFDLMNRQSQTVGGQLSNLADQFTKGRVAAFDAFSPALAEGIQALSNILKEVGERVTFLDDLAAASEDLGDALSLATPLQEGLAEAIATIVDSGLEVVVGLFENLTEFLSDDAAIRTFSGALQDVAGAIALIIGLPGDAFNLLAGGIKFAADNALILAPALIAMNAQLIIAATTTALAATRDAIATAARLAYAIATDKAALAALGFTSANLKAAASTAAIGGAAASIGLVVDTFVKADEAAKEFRRSADEINDALALVSNSSGDFAELGTTIETQVTSNMRQLQDELGGVQGLLDKVRDVIPFLSTELEASSNRQTVAFDDIRNAADDVLNSFDALKATGFADEEKVERQKRALETAIEELERARDVATDPSVITATNVYLNQLQSALTEIENLSNNVDIGNLFGSDLPAPPNADDIIDAYDRQANAARAAIERIQTEQEASVRQQQADRILSEQDADAEIARIRREGLERERLLVETQISEVNRLRSEGTLSEEDAQDRLIDLEQQRADLALDSVEAQIDEQERLRELEINRLTESLDLQNAIGELATGRIELEGSALNRQSNLIQAQSTLIQSQLQLREQLLQNQLDEAEASERGLLARRLQGDIFALQREAIGEEFAARQEVLDIQQQQAELDLERQEILAEIATLEAQVAVERAQLEGASTTEIEALSRILELRQEQQSALAGQREQQAQLNQLQDANLETQRQIAQAQQAQTEAAQQRQQAEERATAAAQEREQGRAIGAFSATGDDIARLNDARRDVSGLNSLGDVLSQSLTGNKFFEQILAARGQDDALNLLALSRADGGQARSLANDIDLARTRGDSETLNKLLAKLEQLANSPRVVNISTPDPIGDVGSVVSGLQRAEAGGLGL